MKKTILLLALLCLTLSSYSQKLTVESFVQTTDAIARTRNVIGTDGNVCAAVVVRIPSKEATFDGGYIIGKPTYKGGEYILDMQQGAAQMRVSVPGYNTIDVKFREYLNGSTLQSKTTYLLTIGMPQTGEKTQTLNIKVTPGDAIVLVDGEIVEGNTTTISVGSHRYNVTAKGYYPQEGTIEVREDTPAKILAELNRKPIVNNNTQVNTTTLEKDSKKEKKTNSRAKSAYQKAYEKAMMAQSLSQNVGREEKKNDEEATQSQQAIQLQSTDFTDSSIESLSFTANGVPFAMKLVEGGTFQMGSTSGDSDEMPVHSVTLSHDYYMGETEVTQALWKAVTGYSPTSDGSSWTTNYGLGDDYPAYYISYEDVQSFISKLNSLTGESFRMPTEAEWEYAARGGSKSNGYTYSGSNTIGDVAWYTSNSGSKTHPVKTKSPNELGLYDMSENVWEWCSDWYGSYSSSAQTNPTGPASGSSRVNRGGSWNSDASYCRCANRNSYTPSSRGNLVGFRLALPAK